MRMATRVMGRGRLPGSTCVLSATETQGGRSLILLHSVRTFHYQRRRNGFLEREDLPWLTWALEEDHQEKMRGPLQGKMVKLILIKYIFFAIYEFPFRNK